MADPLTHSHDTATPALSVENPAIAWIKEADAKRLQQSRKPLQLWVFPRDPSDISGSPYVTLSAAPAPNPSPAAKGGEAGLQIVWVQNLIGHLKGHFPLMPGDDRWRDIWIERLSALATPSPQQADAVREKLKQIIAKDRSGPELYEQRPDGVYQCIGNADGECAMIARSALAALASDPAPAGEAVEPVGYQQRNRLDGVWSDWYPSSKKAFEESEAGPVACYEVRPVYARPAPEDTARLREELERVTRQCEFYRNSLAHEIDNRDEALRERDDARKALETAREALKPFSDYADPFRTAYPDDMPMTKGSAIAARQVTAGDFRRAREAYHAAARSASREGASDE